jgi:hypothetical protein
MKAHWKKKTCLIILDDGSTCCVAIEGSGLTFLPGKKKQFSKQQ